MLRTLLAGILLATITHTASAQYYDTTPFMWQSRTQTQFPSFAPLAFHAQRDAGSIRQEERTRLALLLLILYLRREQPVIQCEPQAQQNGDAIEEAIFRILGR